MTVQGVSLPRTSPRTVALSVPAYPVLTSQLEGPVEVHARAWRRRAASGSALVDAMPDELRFLLADAAGVTVSGMVSSHARPVAHAMTVRGTRDTVELDYAARTLVRSQRQEQPRALGGCSAGAFLAVAAVAWQRGRVRSSDFHYFQCMGVLLERFPRDPRRRRRPGHPRRS